mmetsp:Transcript_49794/g.99987  ORF Transcript_49794/g.99987 Transcript_49794/m.99987 type:complete len:283 (+) Transcript_49794:108-956(+)
MLLLHEGPLLRRLFDLFVPWPRLAGSDGEHLHAVSEAFSHGSFHLLLGDGIIVFVHLLDAGQILGRGAASDVFHQMNPESVGLVRLPHLGDQRLLRALKLFVRYAVLKQVAQNLLHFRNAALDLVGLGHESNGGVTAVEDAVRAPGEAYAVDEASLLPDLLKQFVADDVVGDRQAAADVHLLAVGVARRQLGRPRLFGFDVEAQVSSLLQLAPAVDGRESHHGVRSHDRILHGHAVLHRSLASKLEPERILSSPRRGLAGAASDGSEVGCKLRLKLLGVEVA